MTKFRQNWLVSTFILSLSLCLARAENPAEPAITSVSIVGTNIVVKVSAPAGLRKVTIETRSQLEASAWQPKALKRFEAVTTEAQELTFTFPHSDKLEVLRARADATDALPALFFAGTNQFSGPQGSNGMPPGAGVFDNASPEGGVRGSPTRSVVESDIWKISGDTLYFFNNLRGLQVIDVANPASPRLKGTFTIPASGEEMYVLPSGHAVLLTRNWCNSNGADESKVLIVDGAGATPTFAAETPVPGWILESRMVGDALYVVSNFYVRRTVGESMFWEPKTILTSIDLSNPTTPVIRSSQTFIGNGYSSAIYATDRYLVAVTSPNIGDGSVLQLVDISSPTGQFETLATIPVAGGGIDKFKMNIDGDLLTVISVAFDNTTRWVTTLENFSLTNPRTPVKVGSLRLAEGEMLHATRFDGKRAYIVTFLRIDPLWIVDLSNPTNPRITGELHVPGWSTYLHPLGDRVLALGIDDTNSWRVAVSLFDVSNSADPKLLSKVALGENSSWSEANYNEKALTVLEDAGLILVPYTGYTTNGYSSQVQLVDLTRDSLTRRGQISDHINPRRATVHREHLVSISGREFISHDASNRDQPALKARLDLAWPVNKVLLTGDYLLEFETAANGQWYYWAYAPESRPIIRVAHANEPQTILSSITLTNPMPIAGAELRDGKLYVAQSRPFPHYPVFITNDGTTEPVAVPPPALHMSIWDLASLPTLTRISEISADVGEGYGGTVQALWPKPNLIVWSGGNDFGGWWMMDMAMPMAGFARGIPWGGWWGGNAGGRLAAFDIADSSNPALKSYVDLTTNNGWGFSKAMVVEGLVYMSHQNNEMIPVDPPPPPVDPTTDPKTDPATGTANGNSGWGGTNQTFIFVTKHYLYVVDYSDAANPAIRKPVNIPGTLQGASHQGGVIYTTGFHFNAQGGTDGFEWLDASAYDGVAAYLVDSLSLTNWPHPIKVVEPDIFIGGNSSLDRWQLSVEGSFEKLSAVDTKGPVYDFHFYGDLVGLSGSRILLYDASNRAAFKLIGESGLGCYGAELANGDGDVTRGLWLPQNDYGVLKIGVSAP